MPNKRRKDDANRVHGLLQSPLMLREKGNMRSAPGTNAKRMRWAWRSNGHRMPNGVSRETVSPSALSNRSGFHPIVWGTFRIWLSGIARGTTRGPNLLAAMPQQHGRVRRLSREARRRYPLPISASNRPQSSIYSRIIQDYALSAAGLTINQVTLYLSYAATLYSPTRH